MNGNRMQRDALLLLGWLVSAFCFATTGIMVLAHQNCWFAVLFAAIGQWNLSLAMWRSRLIREIAQVKAMRRQIEQLKLPDRDAM